MKHEASESAWISYVGCQKESEASFESGDSILVCLDTHLLGTLLCCHSWLELLLEILCLLP